LPLISLVIPLYAKDHALTTGNGWTSLRTRVQTWNSKLHEHAQTFRDDHPDANVRVFDAGGVFAKVLDSPKEYGFKDSLTQYMLSEAVEEECIWYDELHPTSKMYKIVAGELAEFLTGQGTGGVEE